MKPDKHFRCFVHLRLCSQLSDVATLIYLVISLKCNTPKTTHQGLFRTT